MKTVPRLVRAARAMARHLSPGGLLIVEPWLTPDRFESGRLVFNRADEPGLKVARMYLTVRRGAISVFDSHYLVAGPAGIRHFRERQELGLFTARQYPGGVSGGGAPCASSD